MNRIRLVVVLSLVIACTGCPDDEVVVPTEVGLAVGVYAPLGDIIPTATEQQRETFDEGVLVATHRFTPEEGLGPLMNVTFCAACHERPQFGGSAGRYRDFYIQRQGLPDGSLAAADNRGGVVAAYSIGESVARPNLYDETNIIAQRNPIPFFGVGLIAELPDASILANADEDDADGDGISGRPNYDTGFVGRFGRKSQTVSIEGFIRGPLFNHMGITTDPLTEAQLDSLPVPSGREPGLSTTEGALRTRVLAQVSAPAEPLTDTDDVADPEMSGDELFALVSWALLLAAPEPDSLDEDDLIGQQTFDDLGCGTCHVPSLVGPRGRIPLYSDLLLHDMGDDLADGLVMGLATGNEFRTQPLWGLSPVGPYLHDGRADTIEAAILQHGGEASDTAAAFEGLSQEDRDRVVGFLRALGGESQYSTGLVPDGTPIPPVGEPGGPERSLDPDEQARFISGREVFDRDIFVEDGLGPRMNGDSCRACHFEPVIGGAGPLDVNVMRHGQWDGETFLVPDYGTILSKLAVPGATRREHTGDHNVFELRQTPSLLGLGLIDAIPDEAILALADPDDDDEDGIQGVAHVLPDGRLGRFGWKAGVPSLLEFARDGLSNEVGLTVPDVDGQTFGFLSDDDSASDPEISAQEIADLVFFMQMLAAPAPVDDHPAGRLVFDAIGCGDCHTPSLDGPDGPVPLFSDILLHDVGSASDGGIPDGSATGEQFRTPPLWGLSQTGPYMHDGLSSTVEAAIERHSEEGQAATDAYQALSDQEREDLLRFLQGL